MADLGPGVHFFRLSLPVKSVAVVGPGGAGANGAPGPTGGSAGGA
jgi:hypothetical protein